MASFQGGFFADVRRPGRAAFVVVPAVRGVLVRCVLRSALA